MVRKASDMVLLLGSRGQYRGRHGSGFSGALQRATASLLQFVGFSGRPNVRRGETRASRASTVSGWIALAGALLCFGVGYLVGHSTAKPAEPGNAGAALKADGGNGPTPPAMIGDFDVRPLASQAFVVAAYEMEPAEAKLRAKALAEWLRAQKLQKARPFEYPGKTGPVWIVAVYYDGDTEQAATRERLSLLPQDVPDDVFTSLRKRPDWPVAVAIPAR